MPKSNRDYWGPKLERNIKRFRENRASLKRMGWRVFILWECEAGKPDRITRLARRIREHEDF